MSKRAGESTIFLENNVMISSFAASGGKNEAKGPFGDCYDYRDADDLFGQSCFEDAESAMQSLTLKIALEKRGIEASGLSFILGGDLLNQCIGTTFALADFKAPFIGLYGACSTISEGLMLASLLVDSGAGDRAAAITSSHYCTAERQYRFPLNYGGQRTPTSQWTATASGALILERGKTPPFVRAVTVGRICDKGIIDANNMGAAMAPAAHWVIKTFLSDAKMSPQDFDLIVTGDLGRVGSKIFCELLLRDGIDILDRHFDCGASLYGEEQDSHSGASGCGCAAGLLCGHFLPRLKSGELKNILFAATGALLSPTSSQQGKSIPGISHLCWLSSEAG